MGTENIELAKKKRGGQTGNRNARTHGFYSRELTTEQADALEAAHGVQDLDQEIALLRMKIQAIANSPNDNFPALLLALSLLTKMITVDTELKSVAEEKEAQQVFQEELERTERAAAKAQAKRQSDFERYVAKLELEHRNDPDFLSEQDD